MEINIKNAFVVAVKVSCGPIRGKYRLLTEKAQSICSQMIHFFLQRPLLTTVLFSLFMILLIIVLSVAFIVIVGVLVFVLIILLLEGFIFITFVVVLCTIIATVVLIVIITLGIKYKISILLDFV